MTTIQKTIQILTVLFTISCNQTEQLTSKQSDKRSSGNQIDNNPNWQDSCIIKYINLSDNEFIKLSRKDTSIHLQWILDRVEKTDSSKYFVYRIGHDVSDENGNELRFVSDAWLYIDSLTRRIYEYDSINDSINEWWK